MLPITADIEWLTEEAFASLKEYDVVFVRPYVGKQRLIQMRVMHNYGDKVELQIIDSEYIALHPSATLNLTFSLFDCGILSYGPPLKQ